MVNDAVHKIATFVPLLGRKNQTKLIGYDLIEQNRKAKFQGKVDCLISQSPHLQGYNAAYQIYRKRLFNKIPGKTLGVPIDIILPENLIDVATYNNIPNSHKKGLTIVNWELLFIHHIKYLINYG